MSEERPLTGPDLAAGVPISDLEDGGMLLGHAHGEAVLLVRRGREIFAVGAKCTHYGGPLPEGVVVDDTLRCPWHHACFSLRTGEPLRAPALDPIPCWQVAREGNRVRVENRLPEPGPRAAPPGAPESIVIVGAGAAGNLAAETVRREGYTGPVTLIGAEETGPVDRPNLSKDYLAGNAPEEWIPLRSPEFYREHGIDLLRGVAVTGIDPANRRVELMEGRLIPYGALLLATGAAPVHLDVPGGSLPHVHTLRTLADSRAIIARAQSARRAIVIGASFIGLEVAASLRARGIEVHVVAPAARPLERVLGPEVGDFLRALHESHGVVFHLGRSATAVDKDAVILDDGETLPVDLVVAGIGVRPATSLAEQAGLAIDRGIVVDEFLETSAPGIFAAGDVARYPDPHGRGLVRIEHWVVAGRQGQTAGRNLLGKRERFDAVPFFWSQHYDIKLAYIGHAERWDSIEIDGSLASRDCTLRYRLDGEVRAVVTLARDRESLDVEAAMERKGP